MERLYTNKECPLHETEYCERLNMLSCDTCPAREKSRAVSVRDDLDSIAALMPQQDIATLFHTDKCVLCKGEAKPRVCYAMADLGNAQPEREGRNFIGMKTKMRVGSLIPVQMSCCASCRRKHRILSYLRLGIPLVAAVVMLFLLSVATIRESIASVHVALPLALFMVVVGGAALAAHLLEARLIKRYGEETYVNIMEQPLLAEMDERGWFELQRGKRMSHLIFAKQRLKQGMYTR